MSMVRRFLWMVALFIMAFASVAQAVQPDSAMYDEATNVLSIYFSGNVRTVASAVPIGQLVLDDDNGGLRDDYTLPGGTVMNTTNRGTVVQIRMYYGAVIDHTSYVDESTTETVEYDIWGNDIAALEKIETVLDHSSLTLIIPDGAFVRPNDEQVRGATVAVRYVEDANPTTLLSAEYIANDNKFILTFSNPVQFDEIAEDASIADPVTGWPGPGNGVLNALPPEDRNDNGVLDMEPNVVKTAITFSAGSDEYVPAVATVLTLHDSTVIELGLDPTDQKTFEDYDLASGITMTFPAFAFVDQNYNSVAPVTDGVVTLVPDTSLFKALSAGYDMGTNYLTVDFNRVITTDYATVSKASRLTVELVSGTDVLDSYTLEVAKQFSLANGNQSLRVITISSDAMHIEDMIDSLGTGESLQVSLETCVTYDDEGNGNISGSVPLTVTEETASNKAPELADTDPVVYDAETNTLTVLFDLSLSDVVVRSGFSLTDGETVLTLDDVPADETDPAYAERVSGNKGWSFLLYDDEVAALEGLADKSALTLSVDPYSVFQTRIGNGNRAVVDAPVNYTADQNPPLIATLFYDLQDGVLQIICSNAEFNPDTDVDLTKLTLSDVALADADSTESLTPRNALFYLPTSVVASLNALSNDNLLRPTATISAGLLMNGDGTASLGVDGVVHDGDMISNGVESIALSLTMGRRFQIASYEAFPTPARTIYAALRKISDHGIWYVDNEAWNAHQVDSTEVAAAADFFENETPYDTSMGAREVILDAYAAGNVSGYVPDTTTFVMANVIDEYGLGRNNTQAGLWKAGYLDQQNDVIYLDCNPSDYHTAPTALGSVGASSGDGQRGLAELYAEYVTYKIDPYEETWLRKGLSYFADFLVGSRDKDSTGFVQPTFEGAGIADGIGGANDLTFLSSDLNDRIDYEHAYLFVLYLYEKYGGEEFIGQIATSRRIGINGIQSILTQRWAAGDYDETPWLKDDFDDIYLDFATANLADIVIPGNPYHGLYVFHNASTHRSNAPGTGIKWSSTQPPPYSFAGTNQGFDYYVIAFNPGVGDFLALLGDSLTISVGQSKDVKRFRKLNFKVDQFNFGNAVDYDVQDIDVSSGAAIVPMDHGDWNFDLPADGGNVPMCIIVATNTGDFLFNSKTTPADYTYLFVSQNSLYNRKFELYVISSEEIFSQPGVEAPTVYATQESDTVAMFDTDEDYVISSSTGTSKQYFTSTWLNVSGDYEWHLDGYYANGIEIQGVPDVPVSVTSIQPGRGGIIALGDDFQMQLSGDAFGREQVVTAVANSCSFEEAVRGSRTVEATGSRTRISPLYSIRAEDRDLRDPAVLTMKYDAGKAGDQPVGIYFEYRGQWVCIGGSVDRENATVSARVGKLGSFQVMAGQPGETPGELVLPTEFALKQNYPNPFNPSTTIEMVLPNAGNVRLVVYDILGREVVRLVDGPMRFGSHKIVWDGRNAYGQPLASGVYFVQMQAGDFRGVRKMVLVK